jgi:hypothetical protein
MNKQITMAVVIALVLSIAVVATTFAKQAQATGSHRSHSSGDPGLTRARGNTQTGKLTTGARGTSTDGKSLVNSAGFGIAG